MSYRYYGQNHNALWAIIGLTFLVFVATSINRSFINVLALQPIGVSDRPWTIVTSLFVHAGFGHILGNMFTLYFFGSSLIQLVEQKGFFIIYFAGGILGSIFYIMFAYLLGNPFIPAVGASGAVFAVGGALTVLRPKLQVMIFPIPAPIPLWIAVIGGFLILSFLPFVAWEAHLGGLILGLLAGNYYKKKELSRYRRF
ncbi:MAG: rhomboid family intramembrane serine protease [Chloroflexi bacterium]|nr:rhomboid family intramembrane serine protease [Chloroflexota bacterium]